MWYVERAQYQSVRIPYYGDRTDCYVILPRPGVGTSAVLRQLRGDGFQSLRRELAPTTESLVHFQLPKIDTGTSNSLSKPLAAMGMPRAFRPDAELSGIADLKPLLIGPIAHKTVLRVDEMGTEAAAVTIVPGSTARPTGGTMICNHPYIVAIVDRESGAMLFLGVVNDPNAK